jgi:hypothetical protein
MAGKLTCVNIATTQASSVVNPSIVGPDADWRGDNAEGGTFIGLKYRKLPTGLVVLLIADNISSGKLPVGYRSGAIASTIFDVASPGGGTANVELFANGDIRVTGYVGGSGQIETQVQYMPGA